MQTITETYDINLENCERGRRTDCVYVLYAFIVPWFALFGLFANFLNAIVFMRAKMTPSAFSYLAALSWIDCISCVLIMMTAFARSIFCKNTVWLTYDFQWQTPLFGITTGAANLILACVSCDRLIYLWYGIPNGTHRFCRRQTARRLITAVILISVIINTPYFFVFTVNDEGLVQTTPFYYSNYYKMLNWLTFILLAVLPALFLLIGNAAIIIAFRRWTKQSEICRKHCSLSQRTTQKRFQHQMRLTITIMVVITLYLIGELPAHVTSRKSALNLLFKGDMSNVNFRSMERLEVLCITLNSIQLSLNIIIYAAINPSFKTEFFIGLRDISDVCCNIFGISAILHCWGVCRSRECLVRQESERPRHQQRDSTSDIWHVEVDNACAQIVADMMSFKHNKKTSLIPHGCRTQTLGLDRAEPLKATYFWRRSKSMAVCVHDNVAMEVEEPLTAADERVRDRIKRHSVAI